MGVIGNQPVRGDHLYKLIGDMEFIINEMKIISKKTGVPLTDLIALRQSLSNEALVDTQRQDGDFRDEHAGGYHDALMTIANALTDVGRALENLEGVVGEMGATNTQLKEIAICAHEFIHGKGK